MIIDITPTISENLAVWPEDVSFNLNQSISMDSGENFNLSSMTSTMHIGAHADAPKHFLKEGSSIDEVSLGAYFGPCQVIHVSTKKNNRIMPEDFKNEILAPRILFKTHSYPDPNIFNEDFCSFSVELINFLKERGVILMGLDTPSVDPFDCTTFEAHKKLVELRIRHLEGLVLNEAKEGEYLLSALPLKIKNAEASPVRAILVTNDKD